MQYIMPHKLLLNIVHEAGCLNDSLATMYEDFYLKVDFLSLRIRMGVGNLKFSLHCPSAKL